MPSISGEQNLRRRLKILSDAFLSSSSALDYQAVLQMATKHFKTFTGADASVLLLNNHEFLTPVFSIGIPISAIKDVSLPSSTKL
ncbi:MAG TPA: hypothetical protein VJ440_11905, partial [Candidatus Brocadiaceae bacterium]|nr:hypothetical protein [Candidatus Brocadiaceae bacterium]